MDNYFQLIFKMQKSAYKHKPDPSRFIVYTETSDHNGFRIKNSNFFYKFDTQGGWKDEYGNYYNGDGYPESEPEGALSAEQMSNHDSQEDEYEKEYGSGTFHEEDDDQQDRQHIKSMQKVAENLQALNIFPSRTNLRVYFDGINASHNINNIYATYGAKTSGIINIILEGKGSGHFVVDCVETAEHLVNLEGDSGDGANVHFELQTIQELLKDPLNQAELKQMYKHKIVKQSKPKETKQQPQQKKETGKKTYVSRQSGQQPKVNKQQPKKQQPKKQQPKREEPKREELKKQVKQIFEPYTFDLKLFANREYFQQWMNMLGLEEKIHYKDLKGKTRRQDGHKYGQIQILSASVRKCNEKECNGQIVKFTPLKQ